MTEMLVIFPPLPAGFCNSPAAIQGYIKQIQVFLPSDFTPINIGPNEPTIENRTYPWYKTDSVTGVFQGTYSWSPTLGAWLKEHWSGNTPPTYERRIFVGALADIDTYDGGEAGTVSATTGPFWQLDTDFADKFPLGVGATIATVATDDDVFDDATPGAPQGRGVYFIKPTSRLYDVA